MPKTVISHGKFPLKKVLLNAFLLGVLSIGAAHGQIFVTGDGFTANSGTVSEYNFDGTMVNASLISGLDSPIGIAISGSDLFVVNEGHGTSSGMGDGTIGKYNIDGTTVNAALISGLNVSGGIALSGSHIFVGDGGAIGEYNFDGTVVNASLIPGLTKRNDGLSNGALSIAISGSNLFVADNGGTIGEYNIDGTTVNASLISGLPGPPIGLAVSGSDLFVSCSLSQTSSVMEYTTSGTLVNASLVSGVTAVAGIALDGTNLFVVNENVHGSDPNGSIGEYTTSGDIVNTNLVSGIAPFAIAVVPEPSQTVMLLLGLGLLAFWRLRMRREQRI